MSFVPPLVGVTPFLSRIRVLSRVPTRESDPRRLIK